MNVARRCRRGLSHAGIAERGLRLSRSGGSARCRRARTSGAIPENSAHFCARIMRMTRDGCVANFAQGVMKGQLVLSVEGLCCEGVELFGRREALSSLLSYQLPFLEHVHQFDPHES